MTACKGKNAKGEACRAPAGAGGLCHLHGNPDRAKELGRAGGRKNGHFNGVPIDVPDKMTMNDVTELTTKAIKAVLNGDLNPRQSEALTKLLNLQRQNVASVGLEERFAALEKDAALVNERLEKIFQQGRELSAEDHGAKTRYSENACSYY